MKRTEPSPKPMLTPPVCRLRDWPCQLGQLLGRLSLEQPIRRIPSPELPTPAACRVLLQSSVSSEYSLASLGTVASPVASAAVMLDPPTPRAHTPRRSFWFRPIRISLIMAVLDEPSSTVSWVRLAPKLTPKHPPDLPWAPPKAPPSWESPLRVQLSQLLPADAA